MRTVGVTGGAGFIGTYVCETLIERGYEVVIMDHHNRGEYVEGVEIFLGDVRDETAMVEFAAHVDGIIHLAAVLGTQETIKNPRPAAESNLMGGLNFLEACAQYKIPGTYIAVGNWWMNNSYSISKNMIERFCKMFNNDRGTQVNIVRAVNAYGPRQLAAAPFGSGKVRKITPAFVCRALSGLPVEIYGDGNQVSDMVWVGDVAKALVLALERASLGDIFDKAVEVGDGARHTVNEIAELVVDTVFKDFSVGLLASEVVHLPMRPGEIPGAVVSADTSTLALIGFPVKDLYPLEDGMKKTIKYFNETKGTAWNPPV
jgi:nucleoside-diphosphate-sugar epimerase